MGKSISKHTTNGDVQVNVINHLKSHSEALEAHDIKLWIILIIVIMQLLLTIKKIVMTVTENDV